MIEFDAEWVREVLAERFVGGGEAFDRWLAKHDAGVAAKALEDFAENLNLHTNIPDEWDTEIIVPLCGDDECLFWDMTYDLAKTLRARAAEYRKAVQS